MHESASDSDLPREHAGGAGSVRDGKTVVGPDELTWLLRASWRWNSLRLGLLRALQTSLPGDDDVTGDLKATRTNLIIMQTRLNEREQGFADALDEAVKAGAAVEAALDQDDLDRWTQSIVEAHRRIRLRVSDADD